MRSSAAGAELTQNPSNGFAQRLWDAAEAKGSWICLGLDIDIERLPDGMPRTIDAAREFLFRVIDACAGDVVAFKPNLPFYLALGSEGWGLLREVIAHVSGRAMVITDCKVGDVENTSRAYARAMFEILGSDAITINAYGGFDAIAPLVSSPAHGAFVWTRSSNAGGDELQGLTVDAGEPLFVRVARRVACWDSLQNLGLVVGATHASDVAAIRRAAPRQPLLAPGVGAQGGELDAVVREGFGPEPAGVVVNAGRSTLWASGGSDYADSVRASVRGLRDRLNYARSNSK